MSWKTDSGKGCDALIPWRRMQKPSMSCAAQIGGDGQVVISPEAAASSKQSRQGTPPSAGRHCLLLARRRLRRWVMCKRRWRGAHVWRCMRAQRWELHAKGVAASPASWRACCCFVVLHHGCQGVPLGLVQQVGLPLRQAWAECGESGRHGREGQVAVVRWPDGWAGVGEERQGNRQGVVSVPLAYSAQSQQAAQRRVAGVQAWTHQGAPAGPSAPPQSACAGAAPQTRAPQSAPGWGARIYRTSKTRERQAWN